MSAFAEAVGRTISRWQMIGAGQRLLVAVSGGADSTALLAALLELGYPVLAAHLNHGWRGSESDRDEAAVRDLAAALGVPLVVEPWPEHVPAESGGGLEEQARRVRYAFLLRRAAEHGCARIATGHTRDDQVETVVLRIERGCGIEGLAGILPRREDGVIRPLLEASREQVLAYLEERGLSHVEDSSNRNLRFDRNRIRFSLLPELRRRAPDLDARLARLAAMAVSARRRERDVAARLLETAVDSNGRLDLGRFAARQPAVRALAVRAWLARVRGDLRRIGRAHLRDIVDCDRSGASASVPGGGRVWNEHGWLRFAAASPRLDPPETIPLAPGILIETADRWRLAATDVETPAAAIELPRDLSEAVADYDRLPLPLAVRTWRPGDRIRPLGMRGSRKLSDVFIDAKVPRWQRSRLPIVEAGGQILWIPGVIRSSLAAIQPTTARILRLRTAPERYTPVCPTSL